MYFISIFIISFLYFQKSTAICGNDTFKINVCYFNYVNSLGIPNVATFNDYYQYVKNNYISKSWEDVETLCGKFHALQDCVNPGCMNIDDFKNVTTYGGKYAADYVGNFYGFAYMCSEDGNQRYQNSYQCLKTQNVGSDCNGYANDCTSQKNENICVVNDANTKCGSEAKIYTNTSLFTILCHSRPECCLSASSSSTPPISFSTTSFSTVSSKTTVIPSTSTTSGSEEKTFTAVFIIIPLILQRLFKFLS